MPSREEIVAMLLDEKSGLRESIVRDLGASTVALFAISESGAGELLNFSGTGSLVQFANSHYILTAAHVWEERLKPSQRVGITLKENVDQRCTIETDSLIPFSLPIPKAWNEWGPDLVFLRVPSNLVGGIEAYRRFYPLDRNQPNQKVDGVEVLILMGAPGEFGKYTPTHAELNINGFFSDVNAGPSKHGGFDYIDLTEDTKFPGVPKHFGGVSGGGLWRVQLFGSPKTGKIERQWTLEGVAFFQIRLPDAHVTVRCHGLDSVRAAMKVAS
jgi:hypothetical protein